MKSSSQGTFFCISAEWEQNILAVVVAYVLKIISFSSWHNSQAANQPVDGIDSFCKDLSLASPADTFSWFSSQEIRNTYP